jgi:hypothetical protein
VLDGSLLVVSRHARDIINIMQDCFSARLKIAFILLAALSVTPAHSQSDGQEPQDCFDALVIAHVVGQTPSVIPECDDCIVMRWPWFLDLKVQRVIEGHAAKGRVTVLSVQHSGYRSQTRRWWLRRNSIGGFNLLGEASARNLMQCPAGSPPAVAYITPGAGKTLADLRREGAKAHGLKR